MSDRSHCINVQLGQRSTDLRYPEINSFSLPRTLAQEARSLTMSSCGSENLEIHHGMRNTLRTTTTIVFNMLESGGSNEV